MILSVDDYWTEADNMSGYCTTCDDLTHDMAEPDAREYECPVCEEKTVYGLEEAVIRELVEVQQ